jgi:hypothetical protein
MRGNCIRFADAPVNLACQIARCGPDILDFFEDATPKPGDEGAQPLDLQRPGPVQRVNGRGEKNDAAKGKTCLLTGAD